MTTKILLADDSLTIQKVVKITLANEPFEIIDCAKESEIFPLIKKNNPSVVLLDFNLSESKTGYDLCNEIKNLNPKIAVVMMFGTFDNIDEDSLKKCLCTNRIIKPFDSMKFIALCRSLSAAEVEIDETDIFSRTNNETQLDTAASKPLSLVTQDLETIDWQIQVPGVIGQEVSFETPFPPVIELLKPNIKKDTAQVFPESTDLDYPELEIKTAMETTEIEHRPKSKLIPRKELKIDIEELNISDKGTDVFDLNEFDFTKEGNELDIKNLEDQIRDEVEADLWKVDEKVVVKTKAHVAELKEYDDIIFDDPEVITRSNTPKNSPSTSLNDEMKKYISDEVQKYLKKYIEEYLKDKAEQICWDTIPDLAENIIKQELQKISTNITNKY